MKPHKVNYSENSIPDEDIEKYMNFSDVLKGKDKLEISIKKYSYLKKGLGGIVIIAAVVRVARAAGRAGSF